jgi:hypothetical protein
MKTNQFIEVVRPVGYSLGLSNVFLVFTWESMIQKGELLLLFFRTSYTELKDAM